MVQKKLKTYIVCLVSSILLCTSKSYACGFYDSESDYRAMMFKVTLPSFRCLQPFYYTTSSFYYMPVDNPLVSDPNENDRYQNCLEWFTACQKIPSIDDIYKIQYDADASLFIKSYEDNILDIVFENNSFIKYLTKPENKTLLEYMLFAKKAERYEVGRSSRFEEWDDINSYRRWNDNDDNERLDAKRGLLDDAKNKLKTDLSRFLTERYTFQACRLYYQMGQYAEVREVYDQCFNGIDKNSLMSVWAGLFKAMATPSDSIDYYRLLIQVFGNSDEKKFRSVQLFDDSFDQSELTPKELSTAIVMLTLRDPGRALEQIKKAYILNPNNAYIPFLVLREINKLEDWLITPLIFEKYSITNGDPFRCAYYNEWYEQYKEKYPEEEADEATDVNAELQQENLSADMEYMVRLKSFLIDILPDAKGDIRDFYTIGIAHLSLLQENISDANKFMSMVSSDANSSILLQKKLETIWLATKTQDIKSEKFKNIFLENIADLERISMPNFDNYRMLYTLTLSLANEYLKKGEHVYGNLLRLKSDLYNNYNNSWYISDFRNKDSYTTVEYFDKNATAADMDILIDLLEKPKKSSFEEYLCSQHLSTVNAYKELKGTIAFRNNDLKLAYETFASMPQDYWQGGSFYFSSYLNEDPFIPKGFKSNKLRIFDYKFNKAHFVKELLDLQDKASQNSNKSADYYNRLGDAYFNTTYWGNSWMLMRYSWSVIESDYSKIECLPEWMRNYLTAGTSRNFYEKALEVAVNNEQKAYAALMLRYIHNLNFGFRRQEFDRRQAEMYELNLNDYRDTQVFQLYESNCTAPFTAY